MPEPRRRKKDILEPGGPGMWFAEMQEQRPNPQEAWRAQERTPEGKFAGLSGREISDVFARQAEQYKKELAGEETPKGWIGVTVGEKKVLVPPGKPTMPEREPTPTIKEEVEAGRVISPEGVPSVQVPASYLQAAETALERIRFSAEVMEQLAKTPPDKALEYLESIEPSKLTESAAELHRAASAYYRARAPKTGEPEPVAPLSSGPKKLSYSAFAQLSSNIAEISSLISRASSPNDVALAAEMFNSVVKRYSDYDLSGLPQLQMLRDRLLVTHAFTKQMMIPKMREQLRNEIAGVVDLITKVTDPNSPNADAIFSRMVSDILARYGVTPNSELYGDAITYATTMQQLLASRKGQEKPMTAKDAVSVISGIVKDYRATVSKEQLRNIVDDYIKGLPEELRTQVKASPEVSAALKALEVPAIDPARIEAIKQIIAPMVGQLTTTDITQAARTPEAKAGVLNRVLAAIEYQLRDQKDFRPEDAFHFLMDEPALFPMTGALMEAMMTLSSRPSKRGGPSEREQFLMNVTPRFLPVVRQWFDAIETGRYGGSSSATEAPATRTPEPTKTPPTPTRTPSPSATPTPTATPTATATRRVFSREVAEAILGQALREGSVEQEEERKKRLRDLQRQLGL